MYQNDEYFIEQNANIWHWGCYFMSLGYAAMDWSWNSCHHEDIESIYQSCIFNKSMKEDCYILNPAKVFNTWSIYLKSPYRATYIGRNKRGEDKYIEGFDKYDVNMVILHDKTENNNYHFRYWSRHHSIRDPWSPPVKIGERIGYRYFKVEKRYE